MVIQDIKQLIIETESCSGDEAVNMIAEMVNRSPKTVYRWLTKGKQTPEHMIELLQLKLGL